LSYLPSWGNLAAGRQWWINHIAVRHLLVGRNRPAFPYVNFVTFFKEWNLTRKVIALIPDVLLISLAAVMKSMGPAGVRTAMKYRHPEMKTATKNATSRKCELAIIFKLLILLTARLKMLWSNPSSPKNVLRGGLSLVLL